MVVFILEKVPVGLRGTMSRWLIEPRAGVFVGRVTAIVRDKLWETASRKARGGAGMLVYSCPGEQGFDVRSFGDTRRSLILLDGLNLVRIPKPPEPDEKEVPENKGKEPFESEHPLIDQPADDGQGHLFD